MSASKAISQFSLSRFRMVLKRYLVLNQRTWVVAFTCVAGFLFLIGTAPYFSDVINFSGNGFSSIRNTSMFFYVLGGLILTSLIFKEIHIPTRAFQFLTLPATTFEKLTAVWFACTIVYTVAALTCIFVLSILIETVKGFDTEIWSQFSLFNPFTEDIPGTILTYFFYQSIFLLGAVYFKKNNFLKTLLTIIFFFLGLLFFVNITFLIFGLTQGQEFFINIQLDMQRWAFYLKFLAGLAFTMVFLWLSYLQLKNKQVA